MPNIFLTATDQIINLDYVAAIEVVGKWEGGADVQFHLSTSVTIVSSHQSREAAVAEKWAAYDRMSPHSGRENSDSHSAPADATPGGSRG